MRRDLMRGIDDRFRGLMMLEKGSSNDVGRMWR